MNITQLKQGSLNGLRRQTNECIDNAYRKGYEDGKKEPREVTNVEDTNEYKIGYKVGFEDGKKHAINELPELANKENEIYNDGYNKGLEDACLTAWTLLTSTNTDEIFTEYGTVKDILSNLPMKEIMNRIKAYEEKKKAEEEIRVGDIIYSDLQKITAIITRDNGMSFECIDTDGFGFSKLKDRLDEEWVKVGHTDELSQLFDKLNKGELFNEYIGDNRSLPEKTHKY